MVDKRRKTRELAGGSARVAAPSAIGPPTEPELTLLGRMGAAAVAARPDWEDIQRLLRRLLLLPFVALIVFVRWPHLLLLSIPALLLRVILRRVLSREQG
jgi:hypothetical protein